MKGDRHGGGKMDGEEEGTDREEGKRTEGKRRGHRVGEMDRCMARRTGRWGEGHWERKKDKEEREGLK